jgi:hypothetical protein
MSAATELLEAVRARSQGTPYAVTPTPAGFDVALDVTDPSWYAPARRQHLSRAWTHHVLVDEAAKTVAITDEEHSLSWSAGVGSDGGVPVPVLSATASRSWGRMETKSFQKTFTITETGDHDKVVDFTFDSGEGRDLIRGPARDLGWHEKAGAAERVGLVFGIVGATVAALVVIALVIAWVTGRF